MSSAIKYYNSHKEEVLKYKKEYYHNKNKKYSFFKKIKIKGYTKKESNALIKTAIDLDRCKILFSYGDELKKYTPYEFMELYKFKDFSVIEIEAFLTHHYYEDKYVHFYEDCSDLKIDHIEAIMEMDKSEFQLHIFENHITKI